MLKSNRKGMILFIVLGTIMVVSILSTVILRIILTQSRLTHHQLSRIQSQYAAKAGINYALEMLRVNDSNWPATGEYTRIMRQSGSSLPDFNEPNLPGSVSRVEITVYGVNSGPIAGTRRISAKAIYTYSP
jgi:type II secretory pathway pseudopilin PulG